MLHFSSQNFDEHFALMYDDETGSILSVSLIQNIPVET
jgi:hypothetical protein